MAAMLAAAMSPRNVLPAALLAVILAGCDGPHRSFGYLTAPSATAPAPAPPAPSPPAPSPPSPPLFPNPIPGGGGPSYRPGVSTTAVASGETVDSVVALTDPSCYPNWDDSARCKVFEITAPIDGTLNAAVRLVSSPDEDNLSLFLIAHGRTYVIADSTTDGEGASLPVTAGSSYGIAVMAYYEFPVEFQLRVEVTGR